MLKIKVEYCLLKISAGKHRVIFYNDWMEYGRSKWAIIYLGRYWHSEFRYEFSLLGLAIVYFKHN